MQELEAFEASIRADNGLRYMLEDVTGKVAVEVERQSPTRVDLTAGLWLVGLAGLWLLVKFGIHHLRSMSDVNALQKQVEVIARLKELGYDPKQATQVIEHLLKDIRTGPNDDTVLQTLQKLLSS
jgi:hypothetical protein